jgi:hypothetical protein
MATDIRKKLRIAGGRLKELNDFLVAPDNPLVGRLVELLDRRGGPSGLNRSRCAA